MNQKVTMVQEIEQDGTLRYHCETIEGVAVRVALHQRNGSKRCPIALLHQGEAFLATECDLGNLRDIETLFKHASQFFKEVPWHQIFTAIGTVLPKQTPSTLRAVVRSMDEVEERDIEYVWPPYVALGKFCVLDGDPSSGKTGLVCMLGGAMSQGFALPDQRGHVAAAGGAPSLTLLVSMEDNLEDTIKRRLRLIGAEMSRIKVLDHIVSAGGTRQHFTLEHIPLLEEEVIRYRPRLVYIDSLQLVLGPKVDVNRANQVADALDGLIDLAERYHFALICARHPSKPGQNVSKLIHRGQGNQAIMGRARLGLYVEEVPGTSTKSLLVQSKANGGMYGITQVFSKAGGQFEWCGVSRITKEMLAGQGKGPSPQAFLEACWWLEHRMIEGHSMSAKDLQEDAKEEGITHGVLFAAKKALGVIHTKSKTRDGGFVWYLPPLSTPSTSSTSATSSTSTTSYSSDTSSTCGDGRAPVEVDEENEVDEVYEVAAVVTGAQEPCIHEHIDDTGRCNDCGQHLPGGPS
jgi:hypothetical protein